MNPEDSSYLRDVTLDYLNAGANGDPEFVNEDFVQGLMFAQVSYHPNNFQLDEQLDSGNYDSLSEISGPL